MSITSIVFDIDDTICNNKNRNYEKAIPYSDVIKKINYLHDVLGFKIILHTSRGMISCGGDLEKIIKKNKHILEKWLKDNNVHYDELIFGKPIADLYVDDKALSIDDFIKEETKFSYITKGGSNNQVIRLGNIIKKIINEDDLKNYQEWDNLSKALNIYKSPKVMSYKYNEVYMEYIPGINACDIQNPKEQLKYVKKIVKEIINAKNTLTLTLFNMNYQYEILEKNRIDIEINYLIDLCIRVMKRNMSDKIFGTFSHGDLTLGNIIINKEDLYYIDQRYISESTSYLLDFAKLRMSLQGYEYRFEISKTKFDDMSLKYLDKVLKKNKIYYEVVLLEVMYILRLYRYKDVKQREKVIEFAKEVINENKEIFEE